MRITHITDCFAPRTGGIETQVQGLAERQVAAGDQVRVITATPGPSRMNDGIPVTRISAHLPMNLPVHPMTRRQVSQELTDHPCDVVHIHAGAASPFAWGGVRAARALGLPIVVTVHSMWDAVTAAGNRFLDATPWGIGHGVVVTAVGSEAADRVRRALHLSSVGILPNAIDVQEWRVRRSPRPAGVLRIVSVLRMAPRKRAVPLLAVIGRAIRAMPEAITATIIGDGPDMWRVERTLAHQGLRDHITLTGQLPRSAIHGAFENADVFCQASIRESFGIAALEARTAGLAVVARSQSGTRDFVTNEVDGLLVDDDDAMVQALLRLASDQPLLSSILEHNERVPPRQNWAEVLALAARFYAQAQSGTHGVDSTRLG